MRQLLTLWSDPLLTHHARCLEIEDELARIKAVAMRAGVYSALSDGPNVQYNVDHEAGRWLAAHPRALAAEAWRAGWQRAWSIANGRLTEWRRRYESQVGEIGALRSRLGVVLMELSRRDDSG